MEHEFPVPDCAAVIVAAGRGERFGRDIPKQFLPLAGRPLFAWSLRLLAGLPFVKELVLVVPREGGLPPAGEAEVRALGRPVTCVAGGVRLRQESVANGLAALRSDYRMALVHDAARPFPDPAAIARLARAAAESGGGLLATRVVDTVKRARGGEGAPVVEATLDRAELWLAQTPQAIRADLVPRAIEELRRPGTEWTDEAALLERWGVAVALIDSPAVNFKVTRPDDRARAEALARRAAEGLFFPTCSP